MAHFVGILDGEEDVWGVRIPDLPGCHGGGSTTEEAIAEVAGAAREWVAHQLTRGVPLPIPRILSDVIRDPIVSFDHTSEMAVMIPVVMDQARPVRANVSLDAGLLEAIDEAAKARGLTRSAFLASAARDKIECFSTGLGHEARRSIGTKARTGEPCPQSGIWRSEDRPSSTASIAVGNKMPPHKKKAVSWVLIQHV